MLIYGQEMMLFGSCGRLSFKASFLTVDKNKNNYYSGKQSRQPLVALRFFFTTINAGLSWELHLQPSELNPLTTKIQVVDFVFIAEQDAQPSQALETSNKCWRFSFPPHGNQKMWFPPSPETTLSDTLRLMSMASLRKYCQIFLWRQYEPFKRSLQKIYTWKTTFTTVHQ